MIDFIASFFSWFADYVLPFLIVLTILVFVHEWGHYIVARWNGVKVDVFSIGFGPEIFGWSSKTTGTRWKFSLIPLGGYVKMHGDQDAASTPDIKSLKTMSDDEKAISLHHKSPLARIAVSAAGPAANYLLAFFIFVGIYTFSGVPYLEPVVDQLMPDGPAMQAGLQKNDLIKKINGEDIAKFSDVLTVLQKNKDSLITVDIERNNNPASITIQPKIEPVSQKRILGITAQKIGYEHVSFPVAIGRSIENLWIFTTQTLSTLGGMLIGTQDTKQLGGIIKIGSMANQFYTQGSLAMLSFLATLSLSLGLINLLPIPMLDGGHIAIYTAEIIRGKPLSEKVIDIAFRIGLYIVLGLMIFSFWNDAEQMKLLDFITKWFK